MKKNILVSIFLAVFQFLLLQNTFAEIQYYDSIAIVIGNKALTRNQINTVLYQENITATGNITTNTSKKNTYCHTKSHKRNFIRRKSRQYRH